MVATHHKDKPMADTISAKVTNWTRVAADLAIIASLYAGYADFVTHDTDQSPTELLATLADKQDAVSTS
jgi:hypothetical protein